MFKKRLRGSFSVPWPVRLMAGPLIALVGLHILMARPASAAPPGGSYLFASREACAASWMFAPRECDNAFENAEAEMRERAPSFTTKSGCEKRFQLCRNTASGSEATGGKRDERSFSPLMLGIEITVGGDRRDVVPVLAVASLGGMFAGQPISHVHKAPAAAADEPSQTTFSNDFEMFGHEMSVPIVAPTKALGGLVTLPKLARADPPADLFAEDRRRERLKNAPYIP